MYLSKMEILVLCYKLLTTSLLNYKWTSFKKKYIVHLLTERIYLQKWQLVKITNNDAVFLDLK